MISAEKSTRQIDQEEIGQLRLSGPTAVGESCPKSTKSRPHLVIEIFPKNILF